MALLSSKPVGTLIRVQESGANVNYELAGFNVHGAGTATLVRKLLRGTSAFGSNTLYSGSALDVLCNTTVFNSFPAELQRIIQDVDIICATGSNVKVALTRKCFAPSYTEVGFGNNSGIAENSALSLYNSNAARIKTNNGAAAHWWLRSWYSSSRAWRVSSDGAASYDYPSGTYGVAPAFVLRSDVVISDTANDDGSYDIMYASKIEVKAKMAEFDDKPSAARVILSHGGVLGTLQVCNNYNDAAPTWEDAISNEEHEFTNGTKTAAKWAVGLHVIINRQSSEEIYLDEPVVLVR